MTMTQANNGAAADYLSNYATNKILGILKIDLSAAQWISGAVLIVLLLGTITILLKVVDIRKIRRSNEAKISSLLTDVEDLADDVNRLSAKNEWLVAEMHHRVKNNLQILSSLINSQLSFIGDQAGRDVLLQSKHRLYALSLVHQKLFQHPTASAIEMSCCIKEVVEYLADEYGIKDKINFDLQLVSIKVDADTAIPFALIINELVTNSLRYAFPDKSMGTVSVSLVSKGNGAYRLRFSDNGVGLPEGFDFLSAKSLGKTLIIGLSRQIKGEVRINEADGFEVEIDFKTKIEPQKHFAIC